MKKLLKKSAMTIYHFVKGEKIYGPAPGLRGDVTDLSGDVTGLRGDVTDLSGDVTGLRGDVTGLRGDVTGLRGNIDDCEITDDERDAGVDVTDLY